MTFEITHADFEQRYTVKWTDAKGPHEATVLCLALDELIHCVLRGDYAHIRECLPSQPGTDA